MSNLQFRCVTLCRSLLGVGLGLLAGIRLSAQSLLPVDAGTTVNGFQDNFSGSALGANWVLHGDNVYSVRGGPFARHPGGGDPHHLLQSERNQ